MIIAQPLRIGGVGEIGLYNFSYFLR